MAAVVATVLVAVPLTTAYRKVLDSAGLTTAIHRQVIATIGRQSGVVVDHIDIQGSHVTIDVTGSGAVPPASTLEHDLVDELGPDVTVTVVRR